VIGARAGVPTFFLATPSKRVMRPLRRLLPALILLALLTGRGAAAEGDVPGAAPQIPERDRIRLAEAFRLAERIQDRAWPAWSSAPFAVLLVTPDTEFLIRHPNPSADFARSTDDSLLGPVYWRKRIFPPTVQATFPAVSGVSTIVMGQAENLQPPQPSSRWILTVMHEHFHQWQDTRPGNVEAVNALDLARGDSTGMWMLEFPFPYRDSLVAAAFDTLSRRRADALRARGTRRFDRAFRAYTDARSRFARQLSPDDAKYLGFQLWKEGVARYTEHRVARLAAERYQPTERFRNLEDFTTFESEAKGALDRIVKQLSTMKLAEMGRIAVYASGAADALLLDEVRPDWRDAYVRERFSLDPLIPTRDY
jgi:hypothetical protein